MAWRLSLAFLVFLLLANRSEAAPLCTLTVGSVPVISPLSTSGAVGDLNVACADLASTPTTVTLSYFFNTAVVASGTPTLMTDMGLKYNGAFGPQSNIVTFTDVAVAGPTFGFTIADILVNASLLTPGAQVISFLSALPAAGLPLANPQNAVGSVGTPVPEPATLALLGTGVGGLAGACLRKRRS